MRNIRSQTVRQSTLPQFTVLLRSGLVALIVLSLAVGSTSSLASGDDSKQVSSQGFHTAALSRISVFPEQLELSGPRHLARLIVTGYYEDGAIQDLTRLCDYASADTSVALIGDSSAIDVSAITRDARNLPAGVVAPRGNGFTAIRVTAGDSTLSVPVTVSGFEKPEPISFAYETLVALSKQGCNSGACHGSPSGKGGFRLSLRAFDAELDEFTLIREEYGRRTNPLNPDQSLLLAKPLMRVPHGGGKRLSTSDAAYHVLRDWIAEGCRVDPPESPTCVRLEVYPGSGRVFRAPLNQQQLSVRAHFSDGTIRDVTSMAVYSSSDEPVASVSNDGLITGHDRGEVAVIVRYLEFIETTFLTFVRDIDGFVWNDPPVNNYIDELVYEKLKKLQFEPGSLCSDEDFIRRVYLDVAGVLPSIEQTRRFLQDESPQRRAHLIDELLDSPEYSRFWALKWGDLLRLTQAQVGAGGVHKYHRWVQRAFQYNMPYDQFARELLTATGSTLTNPAANFYRTTTDDNDCVETVSQIFLGSRLQCAKCHNHPFERWTQDNYYGMAAFFTRVKRQAMRRGDEHLIWLASSGEVTQPRTGMKMKPWLPVQGNVEQSVTGDRRNLFVDWLTGSQNPFFGKVEVNRIWSHLFGRGIVDPPDDFRDSNPPANAALLDALAADFSESGFDRKHILRTILNSRTYQASSEMTPLNIDDTKYFSHYEPRLLGAEQLLDAICDVVGVAEEFEALPDDIKATQLPSPDLVKSDFLKVFGQPERQTVCACERSNDSNLGQALQLYNGPLVHGKLRHPENRFRKLIAAGKSDEEIIQQLYLAAFCRHPNSSELNAMLQHLQSKTDRELALEDVCWAILNMNEFLFQH